MSDSDTVAPTELPLSQSGQTALSVCETAARRAGQLALSRFRTDIAVSLKGRANVVTDVDLASERLILDYVGREYPDFGVLSEESEPVPGSAPYTWVVDPIDGTRNFAEGIPHFCVVVAIAAGDAVVAGVTYDPVRDELLPPRRAPAPSATDSLSGCPTATIWPTACWGLTWATTLTRRGGCWKWRAASGPRVSGYRLMGSSALSLAYTACGRIDLYCHHSLSPWDIASGILLAREAGGQVLDRATLRDATLFSPGLIISNPELVAQFLELTAGTAWREMP